MAGEREQVAVVYRVLLVEDDQDMREAVCGLPMSSSAIGISARS
jgi:hypothetical protein